MSFWKFLIPNLAKLFKWGHAKTGPPLPRRQPLLPPRRRRRALTTPNFLVDYALSKSLLDYNTDSWCVFDRLSACPFVAGM